MYLSDLEDAQQLLLKELNYQIGGTTLPSGVINEVWEAAPGAQDTFSEKEWGLVLEETWRLLLVVVIEPDVLQFPLSLLTAAALVDAALTVLTWRSATMDDAEGLICDIEAVLGLRSVSIQIYCLLIGLCL